MKTWRPGYCGCYLEEIYDADTPVGAGQIMRKCPAHSSIPDTGLWNVLVHNEAVPAADAQRHLLANGLGETRLIDGESRTVFKDGISVACSFEGTGPNRDLVVTIVGASNADRMRAEQSLQSLNLKGKRVRVI